MAARAWAQGQQHGCAAGRATFLALKHGRASPCTIVRLLGEPRGLKGLLHMLCATVTPMTVS